MKLLVALLSTDLESFGDLFRSFLVRIHDIAPFSRYLKMPSPGHHYTFVHFLFDRLKLWDNDGGLK